MVIIGAGGFAKELLEVVLQETPLKKIAFYDDTTKDGPTELFGRFPILKNSEDLLQHFHQYGNDFTLGIGGTQIRRQLFKKISDIGGNLVSAIDNRASIGTFSQLGLGCNVLSQACISNDSQIGIAALIYYNGIITHDCILGDFVEISPGATLLGRVNIGDFTQIGANATVLGRVKIGKNCLVGAGAVVTKDVPDNAVVAGIPARVIRYRS